ncbi:MAG: ribonuclease III domain-containing protein [Bacillota bacterium]|nr:ribonuclease III domain-containing protein [Bacillota bacterium]
MINDFFDQVNERFELGDSEINQLSPLVLAYIGDSVYEVFIRSYLIKRESGASVHKLHKLSVEYVKAKAQSDIIHRISEKLTPEETDVVRRGRNARSGTIPKNADIIEYKYATGFESLIGYLYLKKDFNRLMELLLMSMDN